MSKLRKCDVLGLFQVLLCLGVTFAGVLSPHAAFAGGAKSHSGSPARAMTQSANGHVSFMKLSSDADLPTTRKLTLGVDKSLLVEVPVDLKNVLVSNPDVVDAVVQTSRQVYLIGKDIGEANAFFFGPDGQKVLLLEISVNRDLAALVDMLHRLLPGSKIAAEMMGGSVVLSGSVHTPADAARAAELAARFVKSKENVVNMLATGTKDQVLLKVTVAEIQRDALRRIGVDVPGSVLKTGEVTIAQVFKNGFPVSSASVPAAIAGLPLPFATNGNVVQPTWASGQQSVTAMIQALERVGAVRTLAEPNLTAVSGETAKFLAGGEFPVPISQESNKISVEWKPFGVNVSFKPVVLGAGKISLSISAEVSEIASENSIKLDTIILPGLKVRRAETTLELPSGGTLAMAGLLSDESRQSVEGFPGLKNLPVLGALFRSNDYRRRETELVILVTPYLATHARRQEMATPDQGFLPQSELRELFLGHINRVYGGSGPLPPRGQDDGDYGFIIEYPNGGLKG